MGKDPLPAIRRRLMAMAKKEQKMQRREEIRTLVRMRNEKTARNRGRLLRLKEKGLRRIEKEKEQEAKKEEVEQECKSAEDPNKEEDSKEVKRRPLRKSVVRENKRREQRKEKRVRKILMAAPYNTVKKSMKEKKTDEKDEKKKVTMGSRADRSEEVHETPLKRGGNKKRVNKVSKASKLGSDAERKEKVSPTLPSTPSHPKELNQEKPAAAASVNVTEPEKVSKEQGPTIEDLGPDLLHEMPTVEKRSEEKVQYVTGILPLNPSHQEQSQSPASLTNQLPCLASTDTSNDVKVSPTLPLKPSDQEPPKSPSSLSNQEVRQPPCPPLTETCEASKSQDPDTHQ